MIVSISKTKIFIFRLLREPYRPTDKKKLVEDRKTLGLRTSFQLTWLTEYSWLAYSPSQKGAYCMYCTLFSCSGGGGRGNIPVCKIRFSTFLTSLYTFQIFRRVDSKAQNLLQKYDSRFKCSSDDGLPSIKYREGAWIFEVFFVFA